MYADGACLGSYVGGPVSNARGSIMTAKPMSTAAVAYAASFVFIWCPCLFASYCFSARVVLLKPCFRTWVFLG